MFEKNVIEVALLADFYGELLSERKQEVLSLYYGEDLSLAEIADEIGISRQGVRELIKKAEEELLFYEKKLGLVGTFTKAKTVTASVRSLMEKEPVSEALRGKIEELEALLK